MSSIVFFTRYTADIPVSRYRSYAQKNYLEKNGFQCRFYSLYSATASKRWYGKGREPNAFMSFFALLKRLLQLLFMGANEIAVIEFPLLPSGFYRLQNWLLRKQQHIVTDLIYTSVNNKKQSEERKAFLSASDVVITPHFALTKYALTIANDVLEIPLCVSVKEYASTALGSTPKAKENIFCIGWIGTAATSHHLLMVKDCLLQLHSLYHIKLVLIGFDKKLRKELQDLPYTIYPRDANTEISLLKTCDAGILPLPDVPATADMPDFSMIQYMACGLPVLASSNEVTIRMNRGNDNLFAKTSFEWYSCLAAMIQNKPFYKEVGKNNKITVSDFYSAGKAEKEYLSLLQNIPDKR